MFYLGKKKRVALEKEPEPVKIVAPKEAVRQPKEPEGNSTPVSSPKKKSAPIQATLAYVSWNPEMSEATGQLFQKF